MNTVMRRMMASVMALAALAAATSSVSAQVRPIRLDQLGLANRTSAGGLLLADRQVFPFATPLQQRALVMAQLGTARSPFLFGGVNPTLQTLNTAATLNALGTFGNSGIYPGAGLGTYAYPGAGLASAPYGGGGGDPSLSTNPSDGGGAYTSPSYGYDPFGGTLRGIADVTTANANGVLTLQRARITSQQANQAALDTRRKLFDEIRYERMNTPGAEDLRIKDIELALRRARNDPPVTEITSGRSLNDLINHLASQQAKGLRGPDIRLNEDLLNHINLTNGVNGNVGLLRNGSKLNWPLPLQSKDFADLSREVNVQFDKAAAAALALKPVDAGTLKDLKAALDKLNEALDNANFRMTPSEFIESKRYLNMLGETFRALQDPDVGNFLKGGKWTAQGNTVAEFIDRLTRSQGLRVAPASPGDEHFYRALHAALANYDAGIASTASR